MNVPKPFTKKRSQTIVHSNNSKENNMQNQKSFCFNMEELMQFEAARQRALAQMPTESNTKPFSEFVSNRIFINHIDAFNGSHYAKYLSQIKSEVEGEGDGGSEEEAYTDYTKPEDNNDQIEDKDMSDEVSQESEERYYESKRRGSNYYEIFGTIDFINNPQFVKPDEVLELWDNEKRSEFLEKVLSCGYIIYDITKDQNCHPRQIEEAKWIAESIYKRLENLEKSKPASFAKYKDCRTFILISTLLSWAKTKPIDPDDLTLPFTERDFRKRKPHPNYVVHCELEKRIIELGKKYPKHLRTIVIGSGIPYGEEEDIFHFYFKLAWLDDSPLPIFSPGKNAIPVIHINSLSSIIHSIIMAFPEKYHYIIATDPHSITLKQFVKLLAKKLGSGKTVMVSKEEAFLFQDIKQVTYDMLTVNINIIPGYIMDKSSINWGTDRPLKENIDKLISEFREARGLLPIKIFIHGPPASGKSFLAKRLSEYYDIPYLHVKGVIDEAIQLIKDKIQAIKDQNAKAEEKERESKEKIKIIGDDDEDDYDDDEEEEEEVEEEEEEDLDTLTESLREIEQNMDNERKRLDDEYVIRFFKAKMLSNLCQNKGYVIDGYPKTMESTKMLYERNEDEELAETESQGQGSVSDMCNMLIMPLYVESLDASDEFLIDRVIKMPVINGQNTRYDEPEMCRRLAQFRALNTEDNTPLIFYDELEVHPMIYNVENDLDPRMEPTFQAIISRIGPPRNYGKKELELMDIIKQQNLLCRERQIEELKAQKEEIKKAAQEKRENLEKWMLLKNQELEMEEKALLVMGMPLRHYLMKYIFPTLTRGLVEVARIRPDDPVDFLSEFLFRENPEGKMFQPNFEEREEKLEKAIKEYESSYVTKHGTDKGVDSKTYSTEESFRSDAVSRVSSYKCSMVSSESKKSKKSTKSTKSTKSIKSTKSSKSKKSSKLTMESNKTKSLSKSDSSGVCTCQKTKSLSTCSSDVTPPTPTSCRCITSVSSDSCEPCDPSGISDENANPCKCQN